MKIGQRQFKGRVIYSVGKAKFQSREQAKRYIKQQQNLKD